MSHKIRKGLFLVLLSVGSWLGLAAAAFANVGLVHNPDVREVTMTPTATVTPTATPTTFPNELALITITVQPSATAIRVGDRLTVTVHIAYQPRACTFAMYDLTLRQPISDTAWFNFLSPERLGPPAPRDAAFALQAIKPGSIPLTAELYGEEYCGFWRWSYRYGYSPVIRISPAITPTAFGYLPWISR